MSRKAARKVSSAAAAKGGSQHWAALFTGLAAVVAVAVYVALQGQHRMPARLDMQPMRCGPYRPSVPGCSPRGEACGSVVVDDFATAQEVDALREIADRGMALGGGAGGPTILDLTSGALSYGDKFVDVWSVFNATPEARAFRRSELEVYASVVKRVGEQAKAQFGVTSALHLTSPTFFSRISGEKPPITQHDEYWHTHIDLEQYGSFVFTALLYLADAGADFEGGAFEFMPRGTASQGGPDTTSSSMAVAPRAAVQPKRGRLVLFTSGSEHPHRVTRVTSGTRLALTIAFTCNEGAAIPDFLEGASRVMHRMYYVLDWLG